MSFVARNFGLVFGGIFFVVGLTLLGVGVTLWNTERRFTTEAVTVEGTVLTRDIERAQRSNSGSGSSSTKYKTTYRFETRDGDSVEDTDEIDVHVWEGLREQEPVTIEYLRDDPDTSRVAGTNDRLGAALFSGIGGLFSLIGAGVFVYTLRRKREEARLRRDGMDAVGRVVGVTETNFQINRVPQWRIRYRYRDQQGREHDGESGLMTPEEAANISVGQTGPVRYDRNRPETSLWLGPSTVEL